VVAHEGRKVRAEQDVAAPDALREEAPLLNLVLPLLDFRFPCPFSAAI